MIHRLERFERFERLLIGKIMTERSRRVEYDSARSEGTAKAGVQEIRLDGLAILAYWLYWLIG